MVLLGGTFPLLRLYYNVATLSRSSGSTLPLLQLYYKVATFEPELREYVSLSTAVLQSFDVRAGAPGVYAPFTRFPAGAVSFSLSPSLSTRRYRTLVICLAGFSESKDGESQLAGVCDRWRQVRLPCVRVTDTIHQTPKDKTKAC